MNTPLALPLALALIAVLGGALISYFVLRTHDRVRRSAGVADPDDAPSAVPEGVDLLGGRAAEGRLAEDHEAIRRELVERFPELEDYPLGHCRAHVGGLGDAVLERALVFFALLRDQGRTDSVELAERLGIPVRAISGALTGRLSRRSAELGLALPYEVRRASGRTIWTDRAGVAARMVTSLVDERVRRGALARPDRA